MQLSRWALAATLVALPAACLAASGETAAGTRSVEQAPSGVELVEDGHTLLLLDGSGAALGEFTIEGWRQWARQDLEEQLGEPVAIGPQEMPPGAFERFGAASISPGGGRIAFTATTYAMLTTASVVTILDLRDGTLEAVNQVAFGDVEELAWSPDGRLVAYTLGTARAGGEQLRVDDTRELRPVASIDAADVLESAAVEGSRGKEVDPREFLPGLRDLVWSEPAQLAFSSNDPTASHEPGRVGPVEGEPAGELRWQLSVDSQELRSLGPR